MKPAITIFLFALVYVGCSGCSPSTSNDQVVDKTEVYVQAKKDWTRLKNKTRVDGYTRLEDSIYGGEIACDIEPLEGVDAETFEVLPGTQYARDKNRVYYPIEVPCIDYVDCGVCYYGTFVVEGANPRTFEYLGKDYAADGQSAYFRGEKIKNADGSSFKVIDGPEYFYFAVDDKQVYRHNTIFKGADSKSFYYDEKDQRNVVSEFGSELIIGDKNHEWKYTPPYTIEEIDKIE